MGQGDAVAVPQDGEQLVIYGLEVIYHPGNALGTAGSLEGFGGVQGFLPMLTGCQRTGEKGMQWLGKAGC